MTKKYNREVKKNRKKVIEAKDRRRKIGFN